MIVRLTNESRVGTRFIGVDGTRLGGLFGKDYNASCLGLLALISQK